MPTHFTRPSGSFTLKAVNSLAMLNRWFFKFYSPQKRIALLKKNGILLGARQRDGQKIFLYMLGDLFLEVLYPDNDIRREPEIQKAFSDIDRLNVYLEKDVRVSSY